MSSLDASEDTLLEILLPHLSKHHNFKDSSQPFKMPEISAFAKRHQLSWSIDHSPLILCSLLTPLIFGHILSESLEFMVNGVTNTLGIANEHKENTTSLTGTWMSPPHAPPLSIPLLLQPGTKIDLGPTSPGICATFI